MAKTKTEDKTNTYKTLTVYTIVEGRRNGTSYWVRIGAAWYNRDGSLNVKLNALPVNGELHIREVESEEKEQ